MSFEILYEFEYCAYYNVHMYLDERNCSLSAIMLKKFIIRGNHVLFHLTSGSMFLSARS